MNSSDTDTQLALTPAVHVPDWYEQISHMPTRHQLAVQAASSRTHTPESLKPVLALEGLAVLLSAFLAITAGQIFKPQKRRAPSTIHNRTAYNNGFSQLVVYTVQSILLDKKILPSPEAIVINNQDAILIHSPQETPNPVDKAFNEFRGQLLAKETRAICRWVDDTIENNHPVTPAMIKLLLWTASMRRAYTEGEIVAVQAGLILHGFSAEARLLSDNVHDESGRTVEDGHDTVCYNSFDRLFRLHGLGVYPSGNDFLLAAQLQRYYDQRLPQDTTPPVSPGSITRQEFQAWRQHVQATAPYPDLDETQFQQAVDILTVTGTPTGRYFSIMADKASIRPQHAQSLGVTHLAADTLNLAVREAEFTWIPALQKLSRYVLTRMGRAVTKEDRQIIERYFSDHVDKDGDAGVEVDHAMGGIKAALKVLKCITTPEAATDVLQGAAAYGKARNELWKHCVERLNALRDSAPDAPVPAPDARTAGGFLRRASQPQP